MVRNKKAVLIVGLTAVVVLVGAVLALCRCFRPDACPPAPAAEEQAAVPEPVKPAVDPVTERMSDPVYLKKLEKQQDGQQAALRAIGAAKAALEKATEEGASEEELAKLKEQVASAYQLLEENRRQSQRIVAEQMRGQMKK